MGRQSSAAALVPARGGIRCGVGSFAFQGTNGQAVMGAEPDRPTAPRAVAGRGLHSSSSQLNLSRV